ncbi:MAG: hypothetical protein DSY80_03595, partial [Desulfocapsa sp.]
MKKINIRFGVIILGAMFPIVLLVLMHSYSMIVSKKQIVAEMSMVKKLAYLAPEISGLVHELQKERGASAGFVGSKGKKFQSKLPGLRADTDTQQRRMHDKTVEFEPESFDPILAKSLATAHESLNRLGAIRNQIDGFQLSVPKLAAFYTKSITQLLKIIENASTLSTNYKVNRGITAYIALLQAKERAGLERAMGSVGFGSGKFDNAVYVKFARLVEAQRSFYSFIQTFATPEELQFYTDTVSGKAVEEVERMRKIAMQYPETGSTEGVDGTYWF